MRLTHSEMPWRAARGDLADNERSTNVIDPALMRDFYSWPDCKLCGKTADQWHEDLIGPYQIEPVNDDLRQMLMAPA
ncbi:hypothetical protein [Actinomyces urogenitalis]|uniref:hypothetical protein n=1 Tax=Actinomyces urogenitalis TaxID=103621 RepID=UPI00242D0EB4|nr:hypothetical protein [Actinomyces urogenitalis]MCI7457608.1 hypothetical protein [Actinomyces urogenitalis]